MFENKIPNKFVWTYKFLYWNVEHSYIHFYTIETDRGLKYAENIAWGNATFDGCTTIKYLGKNKEVKNGS